MKKFAKVMAVALVAVLALAALVACGPASKPEKAAAALKKNGYAVESVIGSESTLKQVALDATAKAAGLEAGDIIATVMATNGDEGIAITYFKSASVAKAYWNANKDKIVEREGWVSKLSGSMVYTGTEQAVKDAR